MRSQHFLEWIKKYAPTLGVLIAVVGVFVTVIALISDRIPVWYEDTDGDGYGNSELSIAGMWQPSGYVANHQDCYDKNADARPGTESFFEKDRGDRSFDYDCNGTADAKHTGSGSCSNGTANQGWEGSIPKCGESGRWLVDCDRKLLELRTVREWQPRIQECR